MLAHAGTYALAAIPTILAIIAQAEVQTVAQYGVLGGVLAWFMIRAEKLLTRIEHKIVGMNKTMLIWLLEAPTTSVLAKRMCKEELRKLDPEMANEMAGE